MDVLVILSTTLISSMATYVISHLLKRGGVIASAIVTLVSGMILPYFFPTMGLTLATAAACGSYAGMISLENAVDVFEMAAIGILVGILFVAAGNAFPGIGGRLGTMGGIACFSWLGIKKVFFGNNKKNEDAG